MHLSLFSNAFLPEGPDVSDSAAIAHRDGLLRGLALLGVFALLAGITFIGNATHAADADASPFACRRAEAASMVVGRVCTSKAEVPAEASVYLRP